ncbi:HSP20-like chaperone [Sphaerulina musiva SO2202]|uniref:HSP20-like chaperone n=1 Tax=Sphaerulina musiva (strain SO2202) TaxID=692275 RepID=N1QDL1_SPHMS|nr:HSP20-like chaperone [Sphaerulina musiva SO2202]EMF09545.1 HSP20-like chaperone [Sphaerulina musiva SO2202]
MSAQPKDTTDAKIGSKTLTPEVTWAQRSSASEAEKNHIFLTIAVPDVDPKKIKLDIQPQSLSFSGYSESKKADYAVTLEFFAEIDPSASKIHHSPRAVELVLQKKELKAEYWDRLLKDKQKVHFLKTDFDRWVDEDEQDVAADDDDYMSRMGGMGGMGGGADGGFGGIDFSKLGGAAGMGGMGGMGGEDDDEGDEDDAEEMPELEGEDDDAQGGAAGATADKGKAKIEEVE